MSIIEHILKLRDEASPALKKMADEAENADDALKALKNRTEEHTTATVTGAQKIELALAKELQGIEKLTAKHKDNAKVIVAAAQAKAAAERRYAAELDEHNRKEQDEAKKRALVATTSAETVKWGLGVAAKAFAGLAAGAVATGVALVKFANDAHAARMEALNLSMTSGVAVNDIVAIKLAAQASGQSVTDFALAAKNIDPSALAAYRQQAEAFGLKVGPDAEEATREWTAAVAELQAAFDGLKDTLADLFGGSGGFIREFTKALVTSFAYVETYISSSLQDSIGNFRTTTTFLQGWLGQIASALTLLKAGQIQAAGQVLATAGIAASGFTAQMTQRGIQQGADRTINANTAAVVAGIKLDTSRAAIAAAGGAGGVGNLNATGTPWVNHSGDVEIDLSDVYEETANDWAEKQLAAQREVDAQIRAERMRQIRIDGASKALGLAGSAMGGNFGALAAAAGPWGAVAGQAIDLLQQLGEQGADGIRKSILDHAHAVIQGIRELPELIADVLPDVITEVIPELVLALVENLPKIIASQFELFAKLIVMQFTTLPERMTQAVVEGLFRLWDQAKAFFTDLLTVDKGERNRNIGRVARVGTAIATLGLSEVGLAVGRGARNAVEKRGINLPFFKTGGTMPWDGLAYLHAGERVTPSDGASTGSGARSLGGGGGNHFHFYGPVLDKRGLVDLLNRTFGTRGQNMGWAG